MAKKRYRVAQWATGVTGATALKAIIHHPQYDLVGVKTYSDAKSGLDAGELCGTPATGIIATKSIEDIIAAKPDCVLYMPHETEYDVVCRLLESGINIVTTRWEFNNRDTLTPEIRCEVDAACEKGQASIYATGSTPGYSTEILPLAFTSIMRRIDCITLTESSGSMAARNSPEMLFEINGFGKDPATMPPSGSHVTSQSTPPSLRTTAAALGMPLDDVICTHEYALTRNRKELLAGTIEAGTIGAMRMEIAGIRNGKKVIRRLTEWWVTDDVEPAWDLKPSGWHYLIEGDTPLEVKISFPVAKEYYPIFVGNLGANTSVNAIPYVVDAAPGIRHTNELPAIIGNFGL
jgi:4-hydroxy-tetrahydrodipicolinate reductase